jgi:hypothetical protein
VDALAAQAPEVDLLEAELKSDDTLWGLSTWDLGQHTSLPSSLMLWSTSNLALHLTPGAQAKESFSRRYNYGTKAIIDFRYLVIGDPHFGHLIS